MFLSAEWKLVPLKNIEANIQIRGFVAQFSIKLRYRNTSNNPIEVRFSIFLFFCDLREYLPKLFIIVKSITIILILSKRLTD